MLKNITLSADAQLIKLAREKSHQRNETLNSVFRQWLILYVKGNSHSNYHNLMDQLEYVSSGKPFSRDELNER